MNASDLRPPSAEELRQRAATLRVVAWAMANGTHSIEALKNAADECETSAARLEAGEKERGDEGLIESMSKTMDFLRTVKCPGMCPYPDICEKAGRCTYAAPSGAGERSAEAEAGEGGGSGAVATPANKSAEDAPVADAREHANPTTLAPSPVISGSAVKHHACRRTDKMCQDIVTCRALDMCTFTIEPGSAGKPAAEGDGGVEGHAGKSSDVKVREASSLTTGAGALDALVGDVSNGNDGVANPPASKPEAPAHEATTVIGTAGIKPGPSPDLISGASPPKARFKAMTAPELLKACGDDAGTWATAFCEHFPGSDWGLMVGWFANAIEHSRHVRTRRAEPATRPVVETFPAPTTSAPAGDGGAIEPIAFTPLNSEVVHIIEHAMRQVEEITGVNALLGGGAQRDAVEECASEWHAHGDGIVGGVWMSHCPKCDESWKRPAPLDALSGHEAEAAKFGDETRAEFNAFVKTLVASRPPMQGQRTNRPIYTGTEPMPQPDLEIIAAQAKVVGAAERYCEEHKNSNGGSVCAAAIRQARAQLFAALDALNTGGGSDG